MIRRYTLLYRPPSFATLPRLGWDLLERPFEGFDKREDLPRSTQYRHGVVSFERDLTPEELAAFELQEVE